MKKRCEIVKSAKEDVKECTVPATANYAVHILCQLFQIGKVKMGPSYPGVDKS